MEWAQNFQIAEFQSVHIQSAPLEAQDTQALRTHLLSTKVTTPRALVLTYRTTQFLKIEQVYLQSSAKVQLFKTGQLVRWLANNIWTPMMKVVIIWIKSKKTQISYVKHRRDYL